MRKRLVHGAGAGLLLSSPELSTTCNYIITLENKGYFFTLLIVYLFLKSCATFFSVLLLFVINRYNN